MKLNNPRQSQRDTEDYILPLVNVVFLLLIFFLLAGSFKAADPLEIQPPQSRSERREEAEGPLIVILDEKGQLALGGKRVADDELQRQLAARLSQGEGGRVVKLKADAAVEAQRVLAVMARLRKAGARKVTLLTALRK